MKGYSVNVGNDFFFILHQVEFNERYKYNIKIHIMFIQQIYFNGHKCKKNDIRKY
jgi:hypothetical protein